MNVRKPAAALAAVVLSFGLTACGGGQSVSEACGVAEDEVKSAMGDLSAIDPTDSDKASETISTMTDALKSTEGKLDNQEVKDAVGDMRVQFEKLEGAFAQIKDAGQDTEKLTQISEELSTVSEDIQAAGDKLDELCN